MTQNIRMISLVTLLTACGNGTKNHPSQLERAQVPSEVISTLTLGQAFDSDTARWSNVACVEGEIESITGPKATIKFTKDTSYEDRLKTLAGQLSVDATFPSVKVEAQAEYASETAATDFRETINLRAEVTTGMKYKLGTVKLSPKGLYFATNSQMLMRSTCKNEFVNEIRMGAYIDAAMTIEYQTKKDKERFGGSLKVDIAGGLVNVGGKLALATAEEKQSVKISIVGEQVGGDAKTLFNILETDIVHCNAQNIKPCLETFSKIITQSKILAQQLNEIPTSYKSLSYITESYADTGITELVPMENSLVSAATSSARETLEQALKEVRFFSSRVSYLKKTGLGLTKDENDLVEKAYLANESNKSALQAALLYCYNNPYTIKDTETGQDVSACDSEKQKALAKLISIDKNVLEVGAKSRNDKKCQLARIKAFSAQEIDELQLIAFENVNWAPIYATEKNPDSGIVGWQYCGQVVDQL